MVYAVGLICVLQVVYFNVRGNLKNIQTRIHSWLGVACSNTIMIRLVITTVQCYSHESIYVFLVKKIISMVLSR